MFEKLIALFKKEPRPFVKKILHELEQGNFTADVVGSGLKFIVKDIYFFDTLGWIYSDFPEVSVDLKERERKILETFIMKYLQINRLSEDLIKHDKENKIIEAIEKW